MSISLANLPDMAERRRAEELQRSEAVLLQTEKELAVANDRLRLAMESGKSVGWDWDVKSGRDSWFGDLKTMFGIDSDTYVGRVEDFHRSVHVEDRGRVSAAVAHAMQNHKPYAAEFRVVRPDGIVRWVSAMGKFYYSPEGEPERMLGMAFDITDRMQAEDALRRTEERYRRIVETTNEGVWMLDSEFRTSFVNGQMAEMLGYKPEEVLGKSVFDFYFPEDRIRKQQLLERRRQGVHEQFDERLRRKDGSELWVRMAASPISDGDGKFDGAFAMVSDITHRKSAESALRESEERLRLAQAAGSVGMFEWDIQKNRHYRSAEMERIYGATSGSIGSTCEAWIQRLHPDDRERVERELWRHVEEGGTRDIEFRIVRPSGEIRWLFSRGNLFRDSAGRPLRILGVSIDITERKKTEAVLSSLSQRLIEAQEQERSRIARDLHDDISQRLVALSLETGRLKQSPPDSAAEISSRMGELSRRINQVLAEVQSMARQLHSSQLEYLGIVAAMRSFCAEFAEQHKLQIDFTCDDIPPLLSKEVSLCLFRILQEALHNAVKHSGVRQFEVQLRSTSDAVDLVIADSGIGFDPEAAMNKRGLGLISMGERLRLVNGTLSIDSQPKRGTRINARAPIAPGNGSEQAIGD